MSVPPAPLDFDPQKLMEVMASQGAAGLKLPPPVFVDMETEVRDYRPGSGDDQIGASMTARFPVLERYQNPMGVMQGGMVAAAVDGVIGPLSYLVAPPSVTSQLTMTYLAPAGEGTEYVDVTARLVSRAGRQLVFDATVTAPDGTEIAVARASQTVVKRRPSGGTASGGTDT